MTVVSEDPFTLSGRLQTACRCGPDGWHQSRSPVRTHARWKERKARNDETRVPKIKGRAPNTSFTGSQVDVARKFKPKVFLETPDSIKSSLNNKNARINMPRANKPTIASKIRSPEIFLRLIRKKDNCGRI